jgi:diguanylate cyclase (GGDEF)-like protein
MEGIGLALQLSGAESVKAACAVVVADLARDPALMPSIYLVRGARLRCQAVSGYWQVFDGMPPGTGVIGATFQSGRPIVVSDTEGSDHYLEAVPAVHSEACVPIRIGEDVIGVINVESEQSLDTSATTARLEQCAELLSARIAELGGLQRESRSERLARHAARLAGLVDAGAIQHLVREAARDVAEMESATIALRQADGSYTVNGLGPQAGALEALAPDVLAQLFGWVESMTSAYTIGEPGGRGFAGHEPLRAAGAEALVVLPLGNAEAPSGVLLLTHSAPIALDTEDIELLELLALQATSALATAEAVAELRRRAASDGLTGLGNHATFHAALAEACARPPRPRLALMVADVDRFKAVNDREGHAAGDRALTKVAGALKSALRAEDRVYRIGGDEFAALVRVADADEARATAERLHRAMAESACPPVSIGVALHEREEVAESLFGRADAALYRVKRGGGDGIAVD